MKFPENVNAVIVCGGRNFRSRDYVFGALTLHHAMKTIGLIIQGGAAGADALTAEWAKLHAIPCIEFKADWNRYGKRAGPKRNKEMLDYLLKVTATKFVIAFPGGAGTHNMIMQTKAKGVPVWSWEDAVNYNPPPAYDVLFKVDRFKRLRLNQWVKWVKYE